MQSATLIFLPAFGRYLVWSFSFLLFPPFLPATIGCAISLIWAVIKQKPFSSAAARKNTLHIITLQTAILALTISIAVLGYVDWTSFQGINERGLQAEMALGGVSVALAIYWVLRMKGYRWYAISLSAFQLLFLWCANVVAGMSLTGRWL